MNPIREYMSEVIINVIKRTSQGFKRGFVKQPVRGVLNITTI